MPSTDDGIDEPAASHLAAASAELTAASIEVEAALLRAREAEIAGVAVEGLADALLGLMDQPLIVLDRDLRVVGWSTGAERRWARASDQVIGRKWSRIKRWVDDDVTAALLDELMVAPRQTDQHRIGALAVRVLAADDEVQYLLISSEGP